MQNPQISIVMPVYNRENLVEFAIESILNQTFIDFEFIIVNDGSTDKTLEKILSFEDNRIKIINNQKNSGIVFSRNIGITSALGNYISMFDSDDIALPNKLEIQYNFLEKNPEFAMVGSWVKWIDENGKFLKRKWKLTASHKKIPAIMLFRNYFVQSTVLIRRNAIPKELYSIGYDIVEDSKMWFDVSLIHKVINIQKYLVLYRVHSNNISDMNEKHLNNSKKLIKYIFKSLDIEINEEEINTHLLIKSNKKITNIEDLNRIEKWLLKILEHNKIKKKYNNKILKSVILNRWIKVCFKSKKLFFKMIFKFITSNLTYRLIL